MTLGPIPAYIIFTSGSTGQPKGVTANHRAVLHDALRQTNALHICAEDGLTLLRPYSVVGGVRAIMTGLLNGASVHPYDIRAQGLERMARWLQEERITIYESVATVFRHFARTLDDGEQFPDLRVVRLGGSPRRPVTWSCFAAASAATPCSSTDSGPPRPAPRTSTSSITTCRSTATCSRSGTRRRTPRPICSTRTGTRLPSARSASS